MGRECYSKAEFQTPLEKVWFQPTGWPRSFLGFLGQRWSIVFEQQEAILGTITEPQLVGRCSERVEALLWVWEMEHAVSLSEGKVIWREVIWREVAEGLCTLNIYLEQSVTRCPQTSTLLMAVQWEQDKRQKLSSQNQGESTSSCSVPLTPST